LAARFAAKEAVMKSLGCGWRQIKWKDIEITGGGKPTVNFKNTAYDKASEKNINLVHVSLSHEKNKAIAFAVSEKK
jgi:holo-[acyl-carrier protein] synthase